MLENPAGHQPDEREFSPEAIEKMKMGPPSSGPEVEPPIRCGTHVGSQFETRGVTPPDEFISGEPKFEDFWLRESDSLTAKVPPSFMKPLKRFCWTAWLDGRLLGREDVLKEIKDASAKIGDRGPEIQPRRHEDTKNPLCLEGEKKPNPDFPPGLPPVIFKERSIHAAPTDPHVAGPLFAVDEKEWLQRWNFIGMGAQIERLRTACTQNEETIKSLQSTVTELALAFLNMPGINPLEFDPETDSPNVAMLIKELNRVYQWQIYLLNPTLRHI